MRTLCILNSGHGAQSEVVQLDDGRVEFTADADIDADGAARAYNPQNTGLDDLRNARNGSEWCGLALDSHGRPFIQGPDDPAPGFYISTSALKMPGFANGDPRREVDAEHVPFIVVSPLIRTRAAGVVLGCKARVTNLRNGRSVEAVVADIGPRTKIGELSIAAAKAIGVPSSPRNGGEEECVIKYELWPGQAVTIAGTQYPLQPA
ncbi:MAG: hypothetical protein QOD99_2629 [Chthoniobacter sp.]|jgi:hypothetical protein|nr:hypothetical protein [Chthoniobacter sp.]